MSSLVGDYSFVPYTEPDSLQADFSFGDIGKTITGGVNDVVNKVKKGGEEAVKKVEDTGNDAVNKVKDEGEKAVHQVEDFGKDVAEKAMPIIDKVEKGSLWAYCHARQTTMKQVNQWEDDWTHNAAMLSSGCGNGGDFTRCINAISETKNTEIIHGVPITYGDLVKYGSNVIVPGSGAWIEGASMGIDGAAVVSNIVAPS